MLKASRWDAPPPPPQPQPPPAISPPRPENIVTRQAKVPMCGTVMCNASSSSIFFGHRCVQRRIVRRPLLQRAIPGAESARAMYSSNAYHVEPPPTSFWLLTNASMYMDICMYARAENRKLRPRLAPLPLPISRSLPLNFLSMKALNNVTIDSENSASRCGVIFFQLLGQLSVLTPAASAHALRLQIWHTDHHHLRYPEHF